MAVYLVMVNINQCRDSILEERRSRIYEKSNLAEPRYVVVFSSPLTYMIH